MLSLKYQALAAMAGLDRFTVDELHEATRISKTTLRSIVERESSRLEKVDTYSTGKPGGQPIVYSLTPAARKALEAELVQAKKSLDARDPELSFDAKAIEETHARAVPTQILAAEYLLKERLGTAPEWRLPVVVRQIEKNLATAEKMIRHRPPAETVEAQSRIDRVKLELTLRSLGEPLRFYSEVAVEGEAECAVLVGALDDSSESYAAELKGALAAALCNYRVGVKLVSSGDLQRALPKDPHLGANLVLFAMASNPGRSEIEHFRPWFQQCQRNTSGFLVLHKWDDKGLEMAARRFSGAYYPNTRKFSTAWLLDQIRHICFRSKSEEVEHRAAARPAF